MSGTISVIRGTEMDWQTDESGYHKTMSTTLSSASHGYESTDAKGGQSIGGVM